VRLSISNIAWDVNEDPEVATLLNQLGLDAIDVAPGKYFSDPVQASDDEIKLVKKWWADKGIEIVGMQALLFGTQGLNLFGSDQSQQAMLAHLGGVCRVAEGLGTKYLVFGSPKNRDRSRLSDNACEEIAVAFFRKLGDIANVHGVTIRLEPNPAYYGANFMTNCAQTAHIVKMVNHDAIKMQFDTGALSINNEDSNDALDCYADLVAHIHLSEKDLVPLGQHNIDYTSLSASIKQYLPKHIVTIETVAAKNESHITAIKRSIELAASHFKN